MKLLIFTDMHGDPKSLRKIAEKSRKADFIVCAGDLTVFGRQYRDILEALNALGKPVFVISGNHETDELLKQAAFGLINIHPIDKRIAEFADYLLVGYGGGGFSLVDERFEKIAKIFLNKIKKIQVSAKQQKTKKKIIFVTHQPPYNNATDLIHGQHAGCKSFTKFIREVRPELVVCGHLHETAGKKDKIGKTIVINPGWQGMILEI
ncbi:metallophosphoesterase [Candidatus Woesearchaeota archaeon]|nr:metallophosphoesterase [Candidatus Woesearchaeota archaeon]